MLKIMSIRELAGDILEGELTFFRILFRMYNLRAKNPLCLFS